MWFWIGLLTVAGVAVGVAVVAGKPKLRRAVVRVVKRQVKKRVRTTQRARRAVRQPAKAPLTGHTRKVGRPSVVRAAKCSAACRMSKKPLYDQHGRMTCDCPCQGRGHGKYQYGSNASMRGPGWKKGPVSGAPAAKVSTRKPAAQPAASSTATATKTRPDPDRSRLLRAESMRKMKAHAAANAGCATGTVSARTVRDKGTGKVTQKLTCDTCRKGL